MKRLNVVTKYNYKRKVILTSIILCWVILLACFVVKLFGGNFFNVVCNNNAFIKVCQWIDSKFIVLFLLQIIVYSIGTFLYIIASCSRKLSKKEYIFIAILVLIVTISKNIICEYVNYYVGIAVETAFLIVIPLLFKTKILWSILYCILANVFSIISVITRTPITTPLPDYSLLAIIMLLDYYIMITLFFLHREQIKRRIAMGKWGIGWFHKEVSKYEAVKKSNLEKIAKLEKENAEIDTKIAELKAKENENK